MLALAQFKHENQKRNRIAISILNSFYYTHSTNDKTLLLDVKDVNINVSHLK